LLDESFFFVRFEWSVRIRLPPRPIVALVSVSAAPRPMPTRSCGCAARSGSSGGTPTPRPPTTSPPWRGVRLVANATGGRWRGRGGQSEGKVSRMLGGTDFKGDTRAKATGAGVERRARSETQRSAEGWGALVHGRGVRAPSHDDPKPSSWCRTGSETIQFTILVVV